MNSVQFEKMFESDKGLPWDYEFLSSCNYITWSIVRNNLNKPWNLKKICRNKIIKIEDVLDSPFLRWDWDELTLNENMTFDIIKNYPTQPWNIDILEEKLTCEQLQQFYTIRDSFIDSSSINSYDSYDSYDSQNFMYEI
jgi:hypothetical protein